MILKINGPIKTSDGKTGTLFGFVGWVDYKSTYTLLGLIVQYEGSCRMCHLSELEVP